MTADADNMSLVQRINASTDRSALIVEWHANVGGGNGTEVWYSQYDKGLGIKIAKAMSAAAAKVGLQNRGAKNSKTNRYGRLGILDAPMPTAVLVELIFLDSKHDTDLWKKNKTLIVETFCKAMLDAAGWKSVSVGGSSVSQPAKPAEKLKPTPSKPSAKTFPGFTPELATFVNGSEPIQVRKGTPGLYATKAGKLPAHSTIKYDGWKVVDGYTWVHYIGFSGDNLFLPVRPVGKAAWGTFK